MKLVQTALFGVRGECYPLKKRSPFGKLHADGQAPVMNVKRGDPEACEPKRQAERERADGRSGETDVEVVFLIAIVVLILGLMPDGCSRRVTVEWRREYQDPVCERCGKVLDGTSADCAEEVP